MDGQLDAFLDEQDIQRILDPICYYAFMGDAGFDAAMDQVLGTFFLTDFKVGLFECIVTKGMSFCYHPQFHDI